MSHGHAASTGAEACEISMLFNWNTVGSCFLTAQWYIRTEGMMAVSCIGAALLTVLLEVCRRAGKEYDQLIVAQIQRSVTAAALRSSSASSSSRLVPGGEASSPPARAGAAATAAAAQAAPGGLPRIITMRASPLQQLLRSILHAVTFAVAYITMLLAMYFNGYIIISIFVGAGVGKFLGDWLVVKVVVDDDGAHETEKPSGVTETTFCCA